MTIVTGALLIAGGLLELGAIGAVWLDFRDADDAARKRADEMPSLMAASKYIVNDWITNATRTRRWGVPLFTAGIIVQTSANLLALL